MDVSSQPPGSPYASPAAPQAHRKRAPRAPFLEGLPGDLLSRILQLLPLRDAFRARRVSRALRDAVEGATFDGGKLEVLCRAGEQWCVPLDSLERLVRDGRLKGSELDVRVQCEGPLSSSGAQPVRLLAALAGRCRSVRVEIEFSKSAETVFRQHVVEVLDALAPGGAAGPLQELELLSGPNPSRADLFYRPPLFDIPEERLAPFSGLQELRLPRAACPSVGAAAAIAARLPALRCLQLLCDTGLPSASALNTISRLGPLRLQRLVLYGSRSSSVGLAALPGTPLGDSLRELHLEAPVHGRPPGSPSWLDSSDVAALARMPRLERLTGYPAVAIPHAPWPPLSRLLRAPRLAALQLALRAPNDLVALACSLEAAPPPPSLRALDLRVAVHFESLLPALASAAGPLLRRLELDFPPCSEVTALSPALAAALAACQRLERLVLRVSEACVAGGAGLDRLAASLAPLRALPPRPSGASLRLELAVRLAERAAAEPQRAAQRAGALAARVRGALAAVLPAASVPHSLSFEFVVYTYKQEH
eukprot:tig00000802_g4287.t1